jgi:DNA topoisomerase-1
VEKGESEGFNRDLDRITLKGEAIKEEIKSEKVGNEKGKLFPTDLGILVNRFLLQYFENIINYGFTASVEKDFDEIAQGKKVWNEMIHKFYVPFHAQIFETQEKTRKFSGERLLGTDPESGENVFVKIGRYGTVVQIGDTESDEKPRFAGLKKGQSMEDITLEDALELFNFPKTIGGYEDHELVVAIGRFGPYIKHNKLFYSLAKTDDPASISEERAIEIIEAKRQQDREKIIQQFEGEETISVLNGRYGPYISFGKKNYKIPKGKDPAKLTLEECTKIIEDQDKKPSTRRKKKS